jgi:hypothetical protein
VRRLGKFYPATDRLRRQHGKREALMNRWTDARDFEIERGYTTEEAIAATEPIREFLRKADPHYGQGAWIKVVGYV